MMGYKKKVRSGYTQRHDGEKGARLLAWFTHFCSSTGVSIVASKGITSGITPCCITADTSGPMSAHRSSKLGGGPADSVVDAGGLFDPFVSANMWVSNWSFFSRFNTR